MALVILGGIAVVAGALLVAAVVGSGRFRRRYESERDDLLRRASPPVPPAPAPDLPPPVRRYLDVTRAREAPPLRIARLRQRGSLRTAADKPWMPFESEQAYTLEPPGFVWLARARLAPLVSMLARDKFVDGRGHMLVSLLGVVTVADARGPEMDRGAGLRYWGEIVAFPEAVRSRYLRWSPLGERRARVTIEQDGLTATAIVEFGDEGLPIAFHAERHRNVNGTPVLTAWSGHSRAWKTFDGRLFPGEWEAVWHLPEGDFSAVRMEVLGVQVE